MSPNSSLYDRELTAIFRSSPVAASCHFPSSSARQEHPRLIQGSILHVPFSPFYRESNWSIACLQDVAPVSLPQYSGLSLTLTVLVALWLVGDRSPFEGSFSVGATRGISCLSSRLATLYGMKLGPRSSDKLLSKASRPNSTSPGMANPGLFTPVWTLS